MSGQDRSDPGGDARDHALLPTPFRLRRGGALHGARIAYESWGALSRARDNAILLFTGLSPSAHAASSARDPSHGWWEHMIGPARPIDTRRYFVLCVNALGSCFGSTGPASIDARTGQPYRLTFPELSVEDIARAGFEAARTLGIEQLDTIIGPSLGGMAVLALAAELPGAARRLVSISGTAAASPFAIALRSIQREAILLDPAWRGGNYPSDQPPRAGMRIARKLGTVTYRAAAEWRERFGRAPIDPKRRRDPPFAPGFAVEGYLDAHAERFVRTFDANSYLYLSHAMDRFDLAAHGGSARAALAGARIERALVIGVESDLLFAIDEQRAIAEACTAAGIDTRFAPLPSHEGHDAFLADRERFGRVIDGFLSMA